MRDRLLALLSRLTRTLAPRDKEWGEALLGELGAMPRQHQLRWSLGLIALNISLVGRHLRRESMSRFVDRSSAQTGLCSGLGAGALIAGVAGHRGPPGAWLRNAPSAPKDVGPTTDL
jgi:hypothetical protein